MENTDLSFLLQKAKLGDVEALYDLATYYQNNNEHKLAFNYAYTGAVRYYPPCERKLAYFYEKGIGTSVDPKMAVHYYNLAISHGDVPSITNLGLLYYKGIGVEKDESRAFGLISLAASKNNLNAISILARFYHLGVGVAKDDEK